MFQNLLKLPVPLSKYNILKIEVIFGYFKRKYVSNNLCTNHVITADICLTAPSPAALQEFND